MSQAAERQPVEVAPGVSGYVSGDLGDWLDGTVAAPTCVLCAHQPCDCPEFGTDEYLAAIKKLHGKA